MSDSSSGTCSSDRSSDHEPSAESSEEYSNSSTANIENIIIDDPFQESDFVDYDDINDNSELLYEGSKLSVYQGLATLFSWFCSYPGISKEAFGSLLNLMNSRLLPFNNKLPNSYIAARDLIKDMLVPVYSYDSCVNDCIVFRDYSKGNFADLKFCPECNAARYRPFTKIAQKKFKYIPLHARLKRMFADRKFSELLQSHIKDDNLQSVVSDLHQSSAWKTAYDINGPFKGDLRGISLGLCTDGTNPFSKERVSYSMWPIMITILNLPSNVRTLHGSILLCGIIPGKSEPKSLDAYIAVLVDEIVGLNNRDFFDAYQNEKFKLKIDILLHILDYPGQSKLFHSAGKL